MNDPAPVTKFQFVGGDLCLDFCNTMGGKRGAIPREKLHSYSDFLSWCEQAGLVGVDTAQVLARKAARLPARAANVLGRAIELREAIYRIFEGRMEGKKTSAEDLAILNGELAQSLGRLRIATDKQQFVWKWSEDAAALDHPLGPIARSAAELLISNDLPEQVRCCAGDNCGWLFIDCTRNHSRRWCDMRDCGNRAKVRRHRLKQRCCD